MRRYDHHLIGQRLREIGSWVLMYNRSTPGSTLPGGRPTTVRSSDISSSRQHSSSSRSLRNEQNKKKEKEKEKDKETVSCSYKDVVDWSTAQSVAGLIAANDVTATTCVCV